MYVYLYLWAKWNLVTCWSDFMKIISFLRRGEDGAPREDRVRHVKIKRPYVTLRQGTLERFWRQFLISRIKKTFHRRWQVVKKNAKRPKFLTSDLDRFLICSITFDRLWIVLSSSLYGRAFTKTYLQNLSKMLCYNLTSSTQITWRILGEKRKRASHWLEVNAWKSYIWNILEEVFSL